MMSGSRDTDHDWNAVAKSDPYWGVLSVEEYRGKQLHSDALKSFFDSGETYIANLFSLIHRHLDSGFAPKRVLDFGCGVGRLLLPLARRSELAIGLDIADRMLELAGQHAAAQNISNVQLVRSDDLLSAAPYNLDLVNSLIVLQHIPPERGYRIIEALLSRLAIGGIGSIQMTYAKSRTFFVHETAKAAYYRRDGNTIVDLLPVSDPNPAGTITMFDYDLNQIMALISRSAGSPVITLPTSDDNHLGIHMVFKKAR